MKTEVNISPALVGTKFHLLCASGDSLCGVLKDGDYPKELVKPLNEAKQTTLSELCLRCKDISHVQTKEIQSRG